MSATVVVSKKYTEQEIVHTVKYKNGDISITMDLTDFLNSVVSEIQGIPFIFTNKQLKNKILQKYQLVINDMKESSVYSVPELPPEFHTDEVSYSMVDTASVFQDMGEYITDLEDADTKKSLKEHFKNRKNINIR